MALHSTRKTIWMDVGFASVVLGWAGWWLLTFRKVPWARVEPTLGLFLGVLVAVTLVWAWVSRRDSERGLGLGVEKAGRGHRLVETWLTALLLLLAAWLVFYLPLRIHFWGGRDDFFSIEKHPIWSPEEDDIYGRPLDAMVCRLALWLTPDSVQGALWLIAALDAGIAFLLYLIIRKVAPEAALYGLAAALLLLVNRGDNTRFTVLGTTNFYWPPLFLLLMALWLFLVSYERRSRLLLVMSCFLLGCCFLINEGTFPLALLGFVFLRMRSRGQRGTALWTFMWAGTIGLLALRLAVHLKEGAKTYQAIQLASTRQDPAILLINLKTHLVAFFNYFPPLTGWVHFWPWGVAALVLSVLLLLMIWRSRAVLTEAAPLPLPWRTLCGGMLWGGIAMLLGVAPFLHIPGLDRTHFLIAPGEAVLLAFAIGMIGRLAGWRAANLLLVGGVGALVAWNTVAAFEDQTRERATAAVNFDKLVHVFQQVHSLAPAIPEDAAVLFYVDDHPANPLGIGYATPPLMKEVLDVRAAQVSAHYTHPEWGVKIAPDGVTLPLAGHKNFNQVILFRCALDGTVSLLLKFPGELLPAGVSAEGYQPLALLKPGPIHQPRFFSYLPWSTPVADIFDTEHGVGLGEGWSNLKTLHGRLSRKLKQDAQLIINPAGRTHCALDFRLEVPQEPEGAWKLEMRNDSGHVLGSTSLDKSGRVQFDIPLDTTHLNVISLHMAPVALQSDSTLASTYTGADCTFRISRADKRLNVAEPH